MMTMRIRPNRRVVFVASLGFFVALGLWPCFPCDPPRSLFYMLARVPLMLLEIVQDPSSLDSSLIFVILWPVSFALIAWLCGWFAGGLVYAIRSVMLRNQEPNDTPKATR